MNSKLSYMVALRFNTMSYISDSSTVTCRRILPCAYSSQLKYQTDKTYKIKSFDFFREIGC